jgi:hypothetical protein
MAVSLVALTLLVGCATSYRDAGPSGGYWEQKGPGELIKVGFSGNAFTGGKRTETYLLYRCAEITKRENKTYFAFYKSLLTAIMDMRSSEKAATTIIGMPTAHAYILFFESPGPGLLNADELLIRLEPKIKREEPK